MTKIEKISKDKKVVLLSLKPFRSDVYYDPKNNGYKILGIKYNDVSFKNGKYILENNLYMEMKENKELTNLIHSYFPFIHIG